jgi:hypothetical protein
VFACRWRTIVVIIIAPATPMIRPATLADLDTLLALEQACFDSDRLSRFRYMLTKAHARTLACESAAR